MAFEVSNGHDTEDYEDLYTITCPSGPRATFPAHRAGPPQSGITRSHLFRDLQFSRWALGFC